VKKVHDLIRRQNATAATLAKFRGKPFDWKRGLTCVHLARFHLRAMGHKLTKVPPIRSALGARRALDGNGWSSVTAMLEAQGLERIAPAQLLLGDLIVIEQEEELGLGAILVAASPFKFAGWDARADKLCLLDIADRGEISAAFRC